MLCSGRCLRTMHTRKPWPMLAAQAAFSSWERPSPNGHATRLPTRAQRISRPTGGKPRIYLESGTPPRTLELLVLIPEQSFKMEEINSVVKNLTPPKLHFLEISPGAGNSNFVKLFARRDVPLSSSSPPPQQCWLCCRSRGSWASRCSCTVLTRCSQGMRSPLMAPLWLTQPSAHRSLSSPSHLIFACAQRPGASGVRTHLLTGFAGRTDSLAPVLALDRAAAPGSSPNRCELGSSLCGPLQVLSSTAFDLPIILAISDTFSAALEVRGPPWSLPSTHDRACRPDASAP